MVVAARMANTKVTEKIISKSSVWEAKAARQRGFGPTINQKLFKSNPY